MFHLVIQIKTNSKSILRKIALSFLKSFSKFNGNFASFFFNDEIRINILKKLQDFGSGNRPQILFFPMRFGNSARGSTQIGMPTKIFKKPIYKTFICGSNINSKVKLPSCFGVNFTLPKHNTSFPINNTSKICQFFTLIHEVSYV